MSRDELDLTWQEFPQHICEKTMKCKLKLVKKKPTTQYTLGKTNTLRDII